MRSIIRAAKKRIARSAPAGLYFPYVNAIAAMQRRKHRVTPFQDGVCCVEDHETEIYISERTRHGRYKRGIHWWVDFLASQYNLADLPVRPGGTFVDCGANVGELGIWARRQGLDYVAFEPEPLEARCCDLNNFSGTAATNRVGLWHEETELKFYSKPNSADSSFIETAAYDRVTVMKTTTLDGFCDARGLQDIEVLKIEAEGAEPEVLRGARKTLPRCRFITVDCGCERGIDAEDTVRDVCNELYVHGFTMIRSDMKRMSLLFENRAAEVRQAA